ncbi:pyridoxamine 5'-phosphate oxidase family protein [uncultured Phenylobacterium sp.]|uniref:pyridoxamine 5'-phosphate oxidase family protein n=1 Tax=uncultured Phenylobacterium sp. TaxID=349273 RepID=UPI0025E0E935|nr:pyridoxamine 5'-phosphate oxidase family protein [uncultured Phenylobacterium sp.]
MSDKTHTPAEVEAKLWKAIEHHKTGMLGVTGDSHHFQPMTAFAEPETQTIWFFTPRDGDLVEAAGVGAEAMFHFQSREVYACLDGRLSVDTDRSRVERFWNPSVAAWYPEGKDDPNLTLLRFDPSDAAVWLVEGGLVKYLFEVVKANASKSTPDVGERRDLNFH